MRRLDPETLMIRREEWAAARARQSPPRSWPSSPTSIKPAPAPSPVRSIAPSKTESAPPGPLNAKRMKVSLMLDPAELLAIPATEGRARTTLRIRLPDRVVAAEIATKALRRAHTTIREHGADNVACMMQGHLLAGDVIAEAGLSAQPRPAKADAQKSSEPGANP